MYFVCIYLTRGHYYNYIPTKYYSSYNDLGYSNLHIISINCIWLINLNNNYSTDRYNISAIYYSTIVSINSVI